MSFKAFNAGCNVVALRKDGRKWGMCCSWAQMVDYDKIALLIGSQSDTGKQLSPGDVVGVSALAQGQQALAEALGSGHGGSADKFSGIPHDLEDTAILIPGAKVRMVCRVRDIVRLPGMEADRFVILDVLRHRTRSDVGFLDAEWY